MRRLPLAGLIALAVAVTLPISTLGGDGGSGSDAPTCTAPAGTWLKVLGGKEELFTTSVVSSGPCGFVAASFLAGGMTDLLLSQVDPGGSGWTKHYRSNRRSSDPGMPYSWVTAAPIEDGGTAVVIDNVLLTVDEAGQPRWAREYGIGPENNQALRFTAVVRLDSGFMVLAKRYRELEYGSLALLRLDNDGGVVWAQHYPDMWVKQYAPLIQTADGHLVVGGEMRADAKGRYDPKGRHFRAVVVKLTLDGAVDWVRGVQMGDKPTGHLPGFQSIGVVGNGDIVLAHGSRPVAFTRLTSDGGHVWSRLLRGQRSTVMTVRQILADGDSILVAGSSEGFQLPAHAYGIDDNAFLARLAADGAPMWIRSYGKTIGPMHSQSNFATDVGAALLLTADRHLVMAGYTDSFPDPPTPHAHYDSLLAFTTIEGFVEQGGNLAVTSDIGNPTEVWTKQVAASVAAANLDPVTLKIDSEAVTYTASDAILTERELPAESSEFELTYDAGKRELTSNMSMFRIDGPAVDDADGDGLRQDWENEAIRLLNPVFELDEGETWLTLMATEHVANLVRVTPWPSNKYAIDPVPPRYVIMYFAVTWARDYGGGLTANPVTSIEDHRGDIERVVIALRLISDRRAKIEWVTTSAHGNANDHSGVWHVTDRTCNDANIANSNGDTVGHEVMCDALRFDRDGRVVLQVSEDKHALYTSAGVCNDVVLVRIAGFDFWGENCGWDRAPGGDDPITAADPRCLGKGLWRFDAYNVGEPDYGYRLVDNLSKPETWVGLTDKQKQSLTGAFPNEVVWSGGNRFCGGLRRGDFSSIVEHALTLPDKCVDNLPSAVLKLSPALAEKLDSHYRVSITTARSAGAGTDASVTVRLENDQGDYPAHAAGNFERGNTDIIHLGGIDIGAIDRVSLSLDNHYGDAPNWFVGKVVVERKGTLDRWVWSSPTSSLVTMQGTTLPLTPE